MNTDTETVIQMAREAGATPYTNRHYPDRPFHTFSPEQLARFAELVADAEAKRMHAEGMVTVGHMRARIAAMREACAKVAEGWDCESDVGDYMTCGNGIFWDTGTNYDQGRADAAAAIRAIKP